MAKSFKEFYGTGGFAMGTIDSIRPTVSLGSTDKPPKRNGRSADARAMGLVANYDTQAPGTMRPAASTNLKKLKEEELEELSLQDVKTAAQRFAKGIYDKLKRMATTKQRYEYAAKVLQDVIDRKEVERAREGLPLRHDIGYYAAAVAQTFHDIDPKKLVKMVKEDLYSDDDPTDTVKGTGYGDAETARKTLQIIKSVDKERQMQIVNTMYNRAKHHANRTSDMEDAMKIFKSWIDKNKLKETPLYNYMLEKGVIKNKE